MANRGSRRGTDRLRSFRGVLGTYSFSASNHRGLTVDDVAVVRAGRHGFTYVGR